jgi:type II secretion system protein N
MTPDRWKRIRWVAIKSGFGFLVFVIALYVAFPYERAKEVAIRQAAAKELDVEIGSAGPTLGLGVAFHDIRVRTRPTTGKPTRFTVEKAKVTFSPWSLLFGSRSYAIALRAFGGQVDIDQTGTPGNSKKTPFRTSVQASGVAMSELPGVKETINLPLGGTLRLDIDLKSETGRYADANGEISFTCSDCVLGDGKTPVKVTGNAFLAGGLTLPRTRLGDLVGRIVVTKGAAKLQGVEAKSPDVEMTLEGDVTLHDPLASSIVNAYLRFKFSDAYLQKAAAVQAMLQVAGAQGKRPDGFYGMKLGGRLGQMSSALSPVSPVGGGIGPSPRPANRPGISPSSTLPTPLPRPTQPVFSPPPPPAPAPAAPEPPPPPPPPPPAAPSAPTAAAEEQPAPPQQTTTPAAAATAGWRGTAAGAPSAEAPAPSVTPPPAEGGTAAATPAAEVPAGASP